MGRAKPVLSLIGIVWPIEIESHHASFEKTKWRRGVQGRLIWYRVGSRCRKEEPTLDGWPFKSVPWQCVRRLSKTEKDGVVVTRIRLPNKLAKEVTAHYSRHIDR